VQASSSMICFVARLAGLELTLSMTEFANMEMGEVKRWNAYTHCGVCTRHCSMAFYNKIIPSEHVLPSERLVSLQLLASGKKLQTLDSLAIRDGMNHCTNCTECTLVCPVGINLQDLWFSLRESLIARDIPNLLVLSPLSIYRGLRQEEIESSFYSKPVSSARKAIADEFAAGHKPGTPYSPEGERLLDTDGIHLRLNVSTECFSCVTCTNSCPIVKIHQQPGAALDLMPHQLMQAVKLRLWDLVFSSRMLWECLGCYQCQQSCPMNVPATDLIFALRNVAVSRTSRHLLQKALEKNL